MLLSFPPVCVSLFKSPDRCLHLPFLASCSSNRNNVNVSYVSHFAARRRHLLFAAIYCTGTPVLLDPQAPIPVLQSACGPPPCCSASPGWVIHSEPPAAAGPEPHDPEDLWPGPGLDTPGARGKGGFLDTV